MSVTQNITKAHKWFIGEDKILEFEVLEDDGKLVTDATKGVLDVSTYTLVWWLAKSETSISPLFTEKRTGTGINIVGIYNASRALNTQRVNVVIADDDTDTLKAGEYFHTLKRLAANADAILTDGKAELQKVAIATS